MSACPFDGGIRGFVTRCRQQVSGSETASRRLAALSHLLLWSRVRHLRTARRCRRRPGGDANDTRRTLVASAGLPSTRPSRSDRRQAKQDWRGATATEVHDGESDGSIRICCPGGARTRYNRTLTPLWIQAERAVLGDSRSSSKQVPFKYGQDQQPMLRSMARQTKPRGRSRSSPTLYLALRGGENVRTSIQRRAGYSEASQHARAPRRQMARKYVKNAVPRSTTPCEITWVSKEIPRQLPSQPRRGRRRDRRALISRTSAVSRVRAAAGRCVQIRGAYTWVAATDEQRRAWGS